MTIRNKSYSELREKIGPRKDVAKMLGIYVSTLRRREIGQTKINEEMIAALRYFNDSKICRPKIVIPGESLSDLIQKIQKDGR